MGRLRGKVALVTGAGQGIGLGIAQSFADEGASLILTGRDRGRLESAVPDLKARGAEVEVFVSDVRVRADAENSVGYAVERFGTLDVLVNNAQIVEPGLPLEDHTDERIEQIVESGLYGTIYHMQAALPLMTGRGGSIINLGSRQGIHGAAGFCVYAAAKEAIRGLSRSAAREWGPFGIRVNVICPSAVSPAVAQYFRDCPEEEAKNLAEVPLRRWGQSGDDIGPVAVFLASDCSGYVTGQTINADGGMQML